MSDDRIFASNNAIGRKWYFLNMIILFVIVVFTAYFFQNFIYTSVRNDSFKSIAVFIHYFVYIIYLITFFSLIDRRLYDIAGSRDSSIYRFISGFMTFIICFQLITILLNVFSLPFVLPYSSLQQIATILDLIFLCIVLILAFFKGKISCASYKDYTKLNKYI